MTAYIANSGPGLQHDQPSGNDELDALYWDRVTAGAREKIRDG
jgi:hypothetical protein